MKVDPEQVKAVEFSIEAIDQCRSLLTAGTEGLGSERFFVELRRFYERKDIVGLFLLSEVWFERIGNNVIDTVKFARTHRRREDLQPMLGWLRENLLGQTRKEGLAKRAQSAVWIEAAKRWVASNS